MPGAWSSPALLDANASQIGVPVVAMNDQGKAVIQWVGYDGANYQLYTAERSSGGSWTLPSGSTDHMSPSGVDANYDIFPALSINSSGKVVSAWTQGNTLNGDGHNEVYLAIKSSGGTWTYPSGSTDFFSPLISGSLSDTNASNPVPTRSIPSLP